MQELDPRIVKISIEVDGRFKVYEGSDTGFAIVATGTKYVNANQNDAEIKIFNLAKDTRNYILTETTPFNENHTPKKIYVDAGRKSYGYTRVYSGNIITSSPDEPPDIPIIMKCLTSNYEKGNIVSRNNNQLSKLSQISKQVADDLSVSLDFQATDKQISNYSYTGGSLKQVDALNDMGTIDAYVDNDVLIVKDANVPLSNKVTIVSAETGMIGIPETTEQGIKVKFLFDGQTQLGGTLRLNSQIYPALNGDYVIYKLSFDITTRDVPFYWLAEALKI